MKSALYKGFVAHKRFVPRVHEFKYPFYMYALDLDELEELSDQLVGFRYNGFGLVSLRDRDYLRGAGSIRTRLESMLAAHGYTRKNSRIVLVTMARFLGFAFNPVNFYYCYNEEDHLQYAVAEVNNTFHERHVYIMEQPEPGHDDDPAVFSKDKQFHVSPFNDMRGEYEMSFSRLGERMRLGVDLYRDGQKVLMAAVWGDRVPLTSRELHKTVWLFPLASLLTMIRIDWQAFLLFFVKKLTFHHKPNPESAMTIGIRKPTVRQRICMQLVRRLFDRLQVGRMDLAFPDGTVWTLGSEADDVTRMRVVNFRFFERLVFAGAIGMGESYVEGEWQTDDLNGVLTFFARNMKHADYARVGRLGHMMSAVRHALHRNTKKGSRKNIHAHYDIGNEFYKLFLDPVTLLYSCGIYEGKEKTLEEAQLEKIARIVAMAEIGADDHVLEIGCGWGGFAIEAAKQTGCRVTGITLSQEQYDLARQRVEEAGLSDRIEIQICDYRDLEGSYDKIVSIEMLEAVGHAYFGSFFETCDRVLKPDGIMVLQVITIPGERYEQYRRKTDWIQKYIFPGGLLPSLEVLDTSMAAHSALRVVEKKNIGLDYEPTLRAWRKGFEEKLDEVKAQGFDEEFIRKWRYYLCYCQAGFATGVIHNHHLKLVKT